MSIDNYIKNVEAALADLKKAVAAEKIQNQKDKTNEQINEELCIRL